MGRLEGKVVFVTGAARAQGRAHAVRFAREGAAVVAVDICDRVRTVPYAPATSADLEETTRLVEAEGGRIVAERCDIRDSAGLDAAVAKGLAEFGRIDCLCANAGISSVGTADGADVALTMSHAMDEEAWTTMLDVNLTGAWRTARAVVPQMIERGEGGSIVFTASTAALTGFPNQGHYCAAKHGLIGLMRSMANDLAPHSIRSNAICPSAVDTPMIDYPAMNEMFRPDLEHPTHEDAAAGFDAINLLPTPYVESEDISNAYVYLLSDESRYVTGTALPVDTGQVAMSGINPAKAAAQS